MALMGPVWGLTACGSTDEQADDDASVVTATLPPAETSGPAPTSDVGTTGLSDDGAAATPTPSDVAESAATTAGTRQDDPKVSLGMDVLIERDFDLLVGRRVGLITNQASTVDGRNAADVLAEADGVELVALFAPEHGIRAELAAGVDVADGVDPTTGVPVFSLYGPTRKPTAEMLEGVDLLVFDLQDVGARFYTYTSTMGLAMQAAADAGIPFVVLDRPNPLGGDRVSGPIRTDDQDSFVGQYPIPAVHGMTTGELAQAIRDEGWLDGLADLDLRVVEMRGWSRTDRWSDTGLPWVPPSPGLPTSDIALVYPATVPFEATSLSYGQGTDLPFGQIGAPWLDGPALAAALEARGLAGVRFEPTTFTPSAGLLSSPPAEPLRYDGEPVQGVKLIVEDPAGFDAFAVGIHLIDEVLRRAEGNEIAVIEQPDFFDRLMGTDRVRLELEVGTGAADIVAGWADDQARFAAASAGWHRY